LENKRTFILDQLRLTEIQIEQRKLEEEQQENDFDDEFADFGAEYTEEDVEFG
jgi:hypothetical protein